mmetsp:Transcript_5678/g.13680  ORF Transcript_5678/g.13680 Transcript_5678/m.13680 type:complete len:103 (-) Transcript_5678:93-401(-)
MLFRRLDRDADARLTARFHTTGEGESRVHLMPCISVLVHIRRGGRLDAERVVQRLTHSEKASSDRGSDSKFRSTMRGEEDQECVVRRVRKRMSPTKGVLGGE